LWSARNPQVALSGILAALLLALVAGAMWTLDDLRAKGRVLATELEEQRAEEARISQTVLATRGELRSIEQLLARRNRDLTLLQRRIVDERAAHAAALVEKERALAIAAGQARSLLGQIEDVRADHALASATGKVYERIWASARREADSATRERIRVQAERDAAIAELAGLRAKLEQLQVELDRLRQPPPPPPADLEDDLAVH
jgi:chromosome segregation ATPase